ncbi:hypothetical protein ECPV1252_46750 [Escherichia coli]
MTKTVSTSKKTRKQHSPEFRSEALKYSGHLQYHSLSCIHIYEITISMIYIIKTYVRLSYNLTLKFRNKPGKHTDKYGKYI